MIDGLDGIDDYINKINIWLANNKIGKKHEKITDISWDIFKVCYKNSITLEEIDIIRVHIQNNKFVICEGNIWTRLDIYFKNDKFVKFFKDISQLTPKGMEKSPNAACGKWELFYRLIRPESTQPKKGDVFDDNGKKIEIKGKESRIFSPSIRGKQYKKITNQIFQNQIVGNEVKQGGIKGEIVFEIEKKCHNKHYVDQFRQIKKEKCIELFEELFNRMDIDGDNSEKAKDIFITNYYNQELYLKYLLKDWFCKYRQSNKFDQLILFGDGTNIIIMDDDDICKLKIVKDYFRINQNTLLGLYVE
jgi:hypothetical protein